MTMRTLMPRAIVAQSSTGGWRFFALVILGVFVLLGLGVGADPTRAQRAPVLVAAYDWVAPGLDSPIAGTAAQYRKFDPTDGSLPSLAKKELREEQDKLAAQLAAGPIETPRCEHSVLEEERTLGERHGRFAPRGHDVAMVSTGRDSRERVAITGGRLPAIIPAEPLDGCTAPSHTLRLADFVAPTRLARLMGYLDAGYFAPT